MFEALRKKTFKKSLFGTVFLLIVGLLLAGYFSIGTFYALTGYVPFEELEPDEIGHQWVTVNLKENFGCYMEEYEYNKDTGRSKTTALYYVVWTGDDNATDFRYMSIRVPASYEKQMDNMANAFYNNQATTPMEISGRIRKLSNEEYEYFKEYFLESGWTEEEFEEATLPYYILTFSSVSSQNGMAIILFLLGIVLLIIGILRLVKGLNGGHMKQFMEDIASIGISESSAESDYNTAVEICKDIKVGRYFTYYIAGSQPRAIPNTKITWAYQSTTTHRTNGIKTGTTYSVIIYVDGWKSNANIGVPNEATAQEMLKRYGNMFPWVILGYSDELKKMYNKDRAQFLQLRYNTVDHNVVEPGFENVQ